MPKFLKFKGVKIDLLLNNADFPHCQKEQFSIDYRMSLKVS